MLKVTELLTGWLASNAVGQRVRLVHTSDPYTRLQRGDEGVVEFVDDIGTLFVKRDNGSNLGLVWGEDDWEYCALDKGND